MNEVKVIRAIPRVNLCENAIKKIRVAAYARVSTDRDEQENSFERQVDSYTRIIKANPEWEFVGIYADPGITGTRADKRPEFQRMMSDCRKGLIDKILVKSIARFARNTVDSLEYIRELKDLGIGVVFETQNIDTASPGGDVMLAILSAMAEEESRTISSNVKWAMQKKFEKGEMMLNYNRFLGYTKNEEGNLVVVESEAQIVRRIFREYLHGYGATVIARRLTEDGIPTATGKSKWGTTVIYNILQNEKYCGIALMNKYYKADVLSKKRVKNTGQVVQYRVDEHHPAIITKEQFDMVQNELKKRGDVKGYSDTNQGKYTSKYAFSKKIICGDCGNYYRRHAQIVNGKYQPTWVCQEHKTHNDKCHQLYITEESIERAFVEAMKKLLGNFETMKVILLKNIEDVVDKKANKKLIEVENSINQKQEEMLKLLRQKTDQQITADDYKMQATKLARELDELLKQKEELEQKSANDSTMKTRFYDLKKVVDSYRITDVFNKEMFNTLVEIIIVKNRLELEFKFKAGFSIKQTATL